MALQVKDISAIVSVLLIATIVLSVGLVTNNELRDEHISNASTSIINQTKLAQGFSVFTPLDGEMLDFASVQVTNATGGEYVHPANYTAEFSPPGLRFNVGSSYNNTQVNVTYNYINTTRTAAYNAAGNASEGLANMSQKVPLIGTVAILAIILGLVFSLLFFRRR
ncbi:MAG: hypothetical protein CL811_12370 [Colwelliaceae bacterium]|jgi:hypothetical protein|nr:hypothetical protein [Colwelliaceae bacterium]|tara:strand:+ start:129 stop:626 length:498 start_codon:yes stop_codon:yes gene_type:complete